eukprot:1147098-Pelagomonas_calceolata.AAC.4
MKQQCTKHFGAQAKGCPSAADSEARGPVKTFPTINPACSHLADLLVGHIRAVLGGDQDGVHALGDQGSLALGVALVFDGHLRAITHAHEQHSASYVALEHLTFSAICQSLLMYTHTHEQQSVSTRHNARASRKLKARADNYKLPTVNMLRRAMTEGYASTALVC